MKDISEELCEKFGVDEDEILGDYYTEHEPIDNYEEGFSNDLLVVKHDNKVTIGYLVHDDSPRDFWGDADGLGKLTVFRSQEDRDAHFEKAQAEGGYPLVADVYRHGQEHWSIANTMNYPDRRWDVAPAGVYEPDSDTIKHIREQTQTEEQFRDRIISDANAILDEYSKCVNGEVYGVVTETWELDESGKGFRMTEEDSCWGFIGVEHAVETLKSDFMPKDSEMSMEPA